MKRLVVPKRLIGLVALITIVLVDVVLIGPVRRVLNAESSNQKSLCDIAKVWSNSVGTQKLSITPGPQQSTLAATYPDLEYIPIFPGSKDVDESRSAETQQRDHSGWRHFNYYAPNTVGIDDVVSFYRKSLSEYGWNRVGDGIPDGPYLLNSDSPTYPVHYNWTDPEGLAPVHFYLNMSLSDGFGAGGGAYVEMEYGRYPDIQNLPVYTGTTTLQRQCAAEVKQADNTERARPSSLLVTTYLTEASPDEVAEFYNSVLPNVGWEFYDASVEQDMLMGRAGDLAALRAKQAGDINSEVGLIFRGGAHYDNQTALSGAHSLNITASTENGMTKVKLYTLIEYLCTSPLDHHIDCR